MILAAGLGTRLWPLTADRGKPAVPFLGRPLIAGLVAHLEAHGFDRIVVNTHHQPESIRRALEEFPRVVFSHEDEILGTAGGLALARDRGLLAAGQPTLIINGKLHTDLSLAKIREAHTKSGAAVTMVLRPNPDREHFREVLVAEDRVVGFGEGRIPTGVAPLLFTGLHVISPAVLASLEPRFSDTVADVYPRLIAAGQVHAHLAPEGVWWEFSTLERYFDLQMSVLRGDRVVAPRSARISPLAHVQRVIAWDGVSIGDGAIVEDAILGEGVRINGGETVRQAVVVRAELDPDRRGEAFGDRSLVRFSAGPT